MDSVVRKEVKADKKNRVNKSKIVLIMTDSLIYLVILGVFLTNVYYFNTFPQYFIADPFSDYEGEPYLYDCSEVLYYPDTIDKIKIGDKYCSYTVGKDFYIKEVSPLVYSSYQYQYQLVGLLILYGMLTNILLLKRLWRKIKDD